MKKNFCVLPDQKGIKLLPFLREHLSDSMSVKMVKRLIDGRRCEVNGRVERFSTRPLKPKDIVGIDISPLGKQELKLDFCYEDEHLIIVDKSPGVVSEDRIFNALIPQFRGRLRLIHRLDKETSGVIMVAKTLPAKAPLEKLFFERQIKKYYLAIVDGRVSQDEGIIENYLYKKESVPGQTIWGVSSVDQGLLAITQWKVLERDETSSLVLCQPFTGRMHQLRVHFQNMGHPILGDHQYGKKFRSTEKPDRLLLHAYRLEFKHPLTGEDISVRAPLPDDFFLRNDDKERIDR